MKRTAVLFWLLCSRSRRRGSSRNFLTPGLPLPIFRVLQPRELDQLLVYPALRKLERFDPVLDAFLLKEEEREQERMDQLENQILAGAPVSAADRAAWRRWGDSEEKDEEEEQAAEGFLLSIFLGAAGGRRPRGAPTSSVLTSSTPRTWQGKKRMSWTASPCSSCATGWWAALTGSGMATF